MEKNNIDKDHLSLCWSILVCSKQLLLSFFSVKIQKIYNKIKIIWPYTAWSAHYYNVCNQGMKGSVERRQQKPEYQRGAYNRYYDMTMMALSQQQISENSIETTDTMLCRWQHWAKKTKEQHSENSYHDIKWQFWAKNRYQRAA